MRRCEDEKMIFVDVNMYRRPPLLEEPFAQTLSGIKKKGSQIGNKLLNLRRKLVKTPENSKNAGSKDVC